VYAGEGEIREGEIAFLNVDVDVLSRSPLEPLVNELGREVLGNYVGREGRRYGAHFSLYSPKSADHAVRRLATIIGALPLPARRLWKGAQRRSFNLGFESGHHPHCLETMVSPEAVQAVAALGASIVVTIYPVQTSRPGA
jgi:hypothetical protein